MSFPEFFCSMECCISKFIEKKIDEVQNENIKEREKSTRAQDIKSIYVVFPMLKMVEMVQIKSWNYSSIGKSSLSCILFTEKIFNRIAILLVILISTLCLTCVCFR